MLDLLFKKKRRQIIIENFNKPTHEVSLVKLQETSQVLKTSFHTFYSLNTNCGDKIKLLIQKTTPKQGQNSIIKLALFSSEQQSCCLTVATANILCSWMEKKEIELIKNEMNQIEKMLQGRSYRLSNCSQMEAFADLSDFPHRIECVNLVLRGIKEVLN
jgi:NifU-like protein involved in Fe-S cluster formation